MQAPVRTPYMPKILQNGIPTAYTAFELLLGPRHPQRGREQEVKSAGLRGKTKGLCWNCYRNSNPCAQRTVRPNDAEMSEFGTEKGLVQGPKGDQWLVPLKPQIPRKLSAKPFSRKGEEGAWWVANVLVSDHLFLRSGHNQVTRFL